MSSPQKCGFIAIVGRPNAGKSTFLNALIAERESVVSNKPQMTRKTIKGIFTYGNAQLIFLDTPGLHHAKDLLSEVINSSAERSLRNADLILRFIDLSRDAGAEDASIDAMVMKQRKPIIDVYTKSDIAHRQAPADALTISSVNEVGFKELVEAIADKLPEHPWLYEEGVYTDQDIPSRVSEVIRESVFLMTEEEVPYSTYVDVYSIEKIGEKMKIGAYLHCETDSQKGILVGKAGAKITAIGKRSREELMEIFHQPIDLFLRVKVSPKWKKTADSAMRALGMK